MVATTLTGAVGQAVLRAGQRSSSARRRLPTVAAATSPGRAGPNDRRPHTAPPARAQAVHVHQETSFVVNETTVEELTIEPYTSRAPVDEPYCGANLDGKGGCAFTVWAPTVKEGFVFLYGAAAENMRSVRLVSQDNGFLRAEVDGVCAGQLYHFEFKTLRDDWIRRRDPYARATQANTHDNVTCIVVDPTAFEWAPFRTPANESQVLYQLHVPTFTGYHDPQSAGKEGTFAAALDKLDHIVESGFTAVQLMPVLEFSGSWGYNPRLLFPTHQACGTPEQLRHLVNESHKRGVSVFFDAVLHHGAAKNNSLWCFDGWERDGNGGIYHEGGGPTGFGTSFSFWKEEIKQMLYDSCAMYFREYNADGIRIDAAHLLPHSLQQYLVFKLRQDFPGKLIMAESNPCEPYLIHELGYDSAWQFSSYFDGLAYTNAQAQLDLNMLKGLVSLPAGFSHPSQVIKFLLGSHDQIGCRKNGGHNHETNMVHRHGVHHLGGRWDWDARARSRMWYAMQCTGQGIPMAFMGTEVMHDGFWHIDEHSRMNWDYAVDDIGQQTKAATRGINDLRASSPALGHGSIHFVHENHENGVLAFERVSGEPAERLLVVINGGAFQSDEPVYGIHCGGASWREVYNSQEEAYGGWEGSGNRGAGLMHTAADGQLRMKLPKYSVLVFEQVE